MSCFDERHEEFTCFQGFLRHILLSSKKRHDGLYFYVVLASCSSSLKQDSNFTDYVIGERIRAIVARN